MAKRTVRALLPLLEASGELKVHRGEGGKGTHVYEVVMPGGVMRDHPLAAKGGDERSPNPIRIRNKEEEEIYIALPDWLDPELWKRFIGKAHNCPRINDRSLAYLAMGLGLKWLFRPIAA